MTNDLTLNVKIGKSGILFDTFYIYIVIMFRIWPFPQIHDLSAQEHPFLAYVLFMFCDWVSTTALLGKSADGVSRPCNSNAKSHINSGTLWHSNSFAGWARPKKNYNILTGQTKSRKRWSYFKFRPSPATQIVDAAAYARPNYSASQMLPSASWISVFQDFWLSDQQNGGQLPSALRLIET